jgi:hypothetical protein
MNRAAIIDLERVAARHWRGTDEHWLGDWLLRAAGGFTGRANSALPLGDPGVPLDEALARVCDWYRVRGLPPMIAVPSPLEHLDNQLNQRSWLTRPGPAFVMVAGLPLKPAVTGPAGSEPPAGLQVALSPELDEAWAARYHYRGQESLPLAARGVLTSAASQYFVSIRDATEVVAIARLSMADGWAGLTAVEVHPEHRRRGRGVRSASLCMFRCHKPP